MIKLTSALYQPLQSNIMKTVIKEAEQPMQTSVWTQKFVYYYNGDNPKETENKSNPRKKNDRTSIDIRKFPN
jgi:hypothetical protein